MRDDWSPTPSADAARTLAVTLFRAATWAQMIAGTATGGSDLSPYVAQCQQRSSEVSLSLAWAGELYGAAQPIPGDLVRISLDGLPLWHGIVESINDYREERGARTMSLTVRSRDASPLWRTMRWATDVYPVGADLAVIARDILASLGLSVSEYSRLPSGIRTVHSTSQLADMTAWEMLTTILFVTRNAPWVDALGKFKPVSRDIIREADVALTSERVVRIRGSRSLPGVTAFRLKWLDPNLSKSKQQSQVLATESITAGFFKLEQERDTYWSDDRRQRAENTFMKIRASVNDGLLPVGSEEYEQKDEFHGKITVTTSVWVPGLATASIAVKLLAHKIPDGVVSVGGGMTIPIGRLVEGTADVAILLTMMSLGTGTYEIWGEPFDYVHAINTTEAYNDAAPGWARNEVEEQNDYVMNEGHAQDIAASELLYRSYEAQAWGVDIVDDPRIEVGDIVAMPDGARLYVTGYSRDLSRGAPAVLTLEGFRV